MSIHDFTGSTPLISPATWTKIKAAAGVAGLALGTIAICAVSTFACSYALGFGHLKGTRAGRLSTGGSAGEPTRDYSSVPIGSGFRRASGMYGDREDAA